MTKPTTSQRLAQFVESEMAQNVDKATVAKALKAKAAELDKEAKPATTGAETKTDDKATK